MIAALHFQPEDKMPGTNDFKKPIIFTDLLKSKSRFEIGKATSIANLKLVIELNLNKGGHEDSHYTSKKLLAAYSISIKRDGFRLPLYRANQSR